MFQKLLDLITLLFSKKQTSSSSQSSTIEIATPNDVLVLEARKWIGVIEKGGDNSGPEIEQFQRAVDGKANKEPWCAAFTMFCIKQVEQKLGIKSEIHKSELVLDVWNKSPKDLRREYPKPGNLILWRHADTGTGHMGIIEAQLEKGIFATIEGNTGPGNGIVREGDGVYRKTRNIYGTQSMPVIGFLAAF